VLLRRLHGLADILVVGEKMRRRGRAAQEDGLRRRQARSFGHLLPHELGLFPEESRRQVDYYVRPDLDVAEPFLGLGTSHPFESPVKGESALQRPSILRA
jgi:hypothetical protein